jgi:hypothetical protein
MTLLSASAVVAAEPAASTAPVAITQPLGTLGNGALGFLGKVMIPEAGLLLLVGSGLMGLAAVVRRATRA